jgi:RimJ/RimL family protein N-acetyltransferase
MHLEQIHGLQTGLRAVQQEDAVFLLRLRLDPSLGKYLNATDPSLERQQQWIANQQAAEGDYYFIITDHDGEPVGCVALYRIDDHERDAELGRWICVGSPLNVVESIVLTHDVGFGPLGLRRIYTRTASENVSVVNFHKRFGARLVRDDLFDPVGGVEQTLYEISANDYPAIRAQVMKPLRSIAEHSA